MMSDQPLRLEVIAALARTIAARREAPAATSYTARLLAEGVQKCAKKLGEEAIEAALAAVSGDRRHLTAEAADVLYHLLVLLEVSGVGLDAVLSELEGRMGMSGVAEKASRKTI